MATDNNLYEKDAVFVVGKKLKKLETSSLKWENNKLQICASEDI